MYILHWRTANSPFNLGTVSGSEPSIKQVYEALKLCRGMAFRLYDTHGMVECTGYKLCRGMACGNVGWFDDADRYVP